MTAASRVGLSHLLDRIWTLVCLFGLGLLPLIGGLCVLGWQTVHYLQAGTWAPVSFLDFLHWANVRRSWIESPSSWLGIWKFFNWLPASLAGVVYGGAISVIFAAGMKDDESSAA